jgi:hypothetical protein
MLALVNTALHLVLGLTAVAGGFQLGVLTAPRAGG